MADASRRELLSAANGVREKPLVNKSIGDVSVIKLFSGKSKHTEKPYAQKRTGEPRAPKKPKTKAVREDDYDDGPASPARKMAGKKALLITLISAAAVCALFAGVGAYAQRTNVIFPKVTLDGVAVGNLTSAQAADALTAAKVDTEADKELKVTLPAGCEMTLSAKQAGCYLAAPDAAEYAYNWCHGGSFFENTRKYIKCAVAGKTLASASGAKLDEDYLKKQTQEAAGKVELALMDGNVKVGETEITVVKGASAVQLDEKDLYDTLKKALLSGKYEPIKYTATKSGGKTEEINLQELFNSIYAEPKNAEYDPSTKAASESVTGRSFDLANAKKLWDEAQDGEQVKIPLILTQPEVTTEKLNSMLFATLLSQKSTSLSGSSAARINNITKAAASLNGVILNPGEEFSYNQALGQRTKAAGYQSAGAYSGGQVVQEVGGGICQVSSTLYYCTLIANMTITSRTNHYFGVNYLPAGLDATVSWPSPDFKFKNSSAYPIKLAAGVANGSVTVQIYGSNPDGISVKMTTESFKTSDGFGATSYRWVYDASGNLISKTKEASSTYHDHTTNSAATPKPTQKPTADPKPSPAPPTPTATPAPATETPAASTDAPVSTAA